MARRRMGHTTVHKGKRVLVVLLSGERFVDKFVESTDRDIWLEARGRINKKDLRVMSEYKADYERAAAGWRNR